ncbi:MAG: hypothetical protein ACRDTO_14065, partial [Mycobacterium sp.]
MAPPGVAEGAVTVPAGVLASGPFVPTAWCACVEIPVPAVVWSLAYAAAGLMMPISSSPAPAPTTQDDLLFGRLRSR